MKVNNFQCWCIPDPLKMLNLISRQGIDLVSITLSKLFTGEGRARVERAMINWKNLTEMERRERALTLIRESRTFKDAECTKITLLSLYETLHEKTNQPDFLQTIPKIFNDFNILNADCGRNIGKNGEKHLFC